MIVTVSNLFPRPDAENRGMYNLNRFSALNELESISNISPVMEWRLWRHKRIRNWSCPHHLPFDTRYVPTPYVPLLGREWNHLSVRRALAACDDVLERADSVVASWLYPDGLAAAEWAGNKRGRGIIVQGSDSWHLEKGFVANTCRRLADEGLKYFPVAANLEERLLSAGVPQSAITLAVNGVNGDHFRHLDQQESRGLLSKQHSGMLANPKAKILLFAGNLEGVKGPDVMLEVMNALNSSNSSTGCAVTLVMIGQGSQENTLAKMIRDKELHNVELLRAVPHKDMPLWLNAADVLCLTSRDEGMPNIVLEAAACGLPVVSFNVGGLKHVADGHHAIHLVNQNDVNAFVSTLSTVLDAEHDRQQLSESFRLNRSWLKQAGIIHNALNGAG